MITHDFISAVAELANNFPLKNLHIAMVAQWILESDRGNSKLARECNNYAGMKWRTELDGVATGHLIKVPSELEPVVFSKFASPQDFVKGFFRFLDRIPYQGWRNKNTPEEYIDHIGRTWATDPSYILKVKSLFPEAQKLIEKVTVKTPSLEDATWFNIFKNRSPDSTRGLLFVGYNGSTPLFATLIRTTTELKEVCAHVGEHNVEVSTNNNMPAVPFFNVDELSNRIPSSSPLSGKTVFIEAGHGWSGSSFDPGAIGHVQEWRQNTIIARSCAEELKRLGAQVKLEMYDKGTEPRDLRTRGRIAGGSDVFVSFHHNAFNGDAQGTETLYDRLADSNDIKLAETIQTHLMTASPFRDRGVKRQGLGVLRGAKTGAKAACLVEAYFVDGPALRDVDELDRRMGIATAAGIAEFLGAK